MTPPAKRRRPNIVEPDAQESSTTPKKNSLTTFLTSPRANPTMAKSMLPSRTRSTRAPTKSPSTSPEKSRRKQTFDDERGKSADLKTMFSKQAQRKRPAATTATATSLVEELDEDPISDGDDVSYTKASSTSIIGQAARKRQKTDNQFPANSTSFAASSGRSTRSMSQASSSGIFLKPPLPSYAKAQDGDEDRPWSERFAPQNLEELAVHKRKVSDVRQWLQAAVNGKLRQRLLVLKGAAGTGKTTTIRLLAQELQCELLEWRNPTSSGIGLVSFSAQFEEFMSRGGKFSQLDLDSESEESLPPSVQSKATPRDGTFHQKLILIEEFPNTFVRSSTALLAFRKAVLAYLANNTPTLNSYGLPKSDNPITPVVMVISETLLTTTSASADSFTAHRLLGPEILQHPGAAVIEFNNVAPTFLSKALEIIVQKESRKSGRRSTPGPQVIKKLGEIGDIRSAISALQFLCIKGDSDTDWGARVSFTKSKKTSKPRQNLTKGEQASLELVTQRESSLGIFHAVGKVVYNKREEQVVPGSAEALAETLPPHLLFAARPVKSAVGVDTLMDEMGTDTGTFLSALHENYPLSCVSTGPGDMNSSLDYISGCLEYLSDSDMLCPSWDIFFGSKGPSGGFNDTGSHILRQDEMGFQVAARGLLFSLPVPVKRVPSNSGGKGSDAFKMFFPTSIKLWRAKEEMEGLLDMWAGKLLHGANDGQDSSLKGIMEGAAAFRHTKPQGVESWATNQRAKRHAHVEKDESGPLLSLGSSARKEMVLERLPYMAHIARAQRGQFSNTLGLRDIEKVVSFRAGLKVDGDDESEGEDSEAAPGETWATDKPVEESLPQKAKNKIVPRGDSEVPGAVGHDLFLSFDDIED
ncbi:hypothetical protein MKZ38_006270 [Zalerion maritima]|uniref:Checkpoint protein RAD24-like helical bundle domain-containing protein n=1 Tax=Zalerion maritima TaxID=339359 RepID=A0AAD5WPU8_9PEZI|nr:hypothetical protein MKZ38_006270 [Zalerion maritima]